MIVLSHFNVSELPSNLLNFIIVLSEYCKMKISGIDSIYEVLIFLFYDYVRFFQVSKLQIPCLFSILQLLLTIIPTISPYIASISSTTNHF